MLQNMKTERILSSSRLATEPMFTKLHEKYQSVEILGQGTYGIVYKAVILKKGRNPEDTGDDNIQYVALKRTSLDSGLTHGIPDTALREMSILKDMNHPNILKTLEFSCNMNRIYVVMELLEKDLKQFIRAQQSMKKTIGIGDVQSLIFKVLNGVSHLHCNRIVHRDLKPHNILVSNDLRDVKLADFGLARVAHCISKTLTHEVITLWYRPPEILLGDCVYDSSVDVWSVGCILAELLCGRPLFEGESELDTLMKIFNRLGTPAVDEWPENAMQSRTLFPKFAKATTGALKDIYGKFSSRAEAESVEQLILWMLDLDPTKRPTATECLRHTWFNSLRHSPEYAAQAKYINYADPFEGSNIGAKKPFKARMSLPEKRILFSEPQPAKEARRDTETAHSFQVLLPSEDGTSGVDVIEDLYRQYPHLDEVSSDEIFSDIEFYRPAISEEEMTDRALFLLAGMDPDPYVEQAYRPASPADDTPPHEKTLRKANSPPSCCRETPGISETPGNQPVMRIDKRGDVVDSEYAESENRLNNAMETPRPGTKYDGGFTRRSNNDMSYQSFLTPSLIGGSSVVAHLTRRISKEFETVGSAISRGLSGVFYSGVSPEKK